MKKICGILILNIIAMLDIGYAWRPKTVLSDSATEKDVKSLTVITTKQALPIILHGTEDDKEFLFPEELTKAKIRKGRLVSGTKFFAPKEKPQVFFCPNSNPNENCLVPKTFHWWQVLKCKKEPLPIIDQSPYKPKCGFEGKGKSMRFVFMLCPAEKPYKYEEKDYVAYHFCYDESAEKTLFVRYNFISVKLNTEKLLSREREVQFPVNKEFIADDPSLLEAANKYESQYTLQKLALTEDFPLVVWRRTTRHVVNIALQHKKLIDLWNKIGYYIRSNANRMANRFRAPDVQSIITGVFDIPKNEIPSTISEDQMYNIWVKIVYTRYPYAQNEGLAILMNNFIMPTDESELNEQYIDKLCGQSSCTSSLKEMFSEVGGRVRCCEVNDAILNLFSMEKEDLWIGSVLPVIDINAFYPNKN